MCFSTSYHDYIRDRIYNLFWRLLAPIYKTIYISSDEMKQMAKSILADPQVQADWARFNQNYFSKYPGDTVYFQPFISKYLILTIDKKLSESIPLEIENE